MEPYLNISAADIPKLNQLKYRPIRAVYFLLEENEIVYVGQTVNLFGRLANHEVFEAGMTVRYVEIPEDVNLLAIEALYIHKFRPKYNRVVRKPMNFILLAIQNPELQQYLHQTEPVVNPLKNDRIKVEGLGHRTWLIKFYKPNKQGRWYWSQRKVYGTRNQAEITAFQMLANLGG
jgi:hypothetical protein